MISDSDPDIVSWTGVGDSFTIKDIDAFQKKILPKYFNHSKFSSFVRQLNFYGFQKLSQESDIVRAVPRIITSNKTNVSDDDSSHAESINSTTDQQNPSSGSNISVSSSRNPANNSARFMHEFFRRGMPELLSKIQRSTAKPKAPPMEPEDYQTLHRQIAELRGQISQAESQVDRKVEQAVQLVRNDYMAKVTQLEASYQSLVSVVSLLLNRKPTMTAGPSASGLALHNLFAKHTN